MTPTHLAAESRRLTRLADELRQAPNATDPAVWATGEALHLAADLLHTLHTGTGPRADTLALARSTVEAIKYALRDGPRPAPPPESRMAG